MLPIWNHESEEWIMDEADRDQREFIADDPTCVWDYVYKELLLWEEAADSLNYDEVPF